MSPNRHPQATAPPEHPKRFPWLPASRPLTRDLAETPEQPRRLGGRSELFRWLAILGPGLIAANAGNDAGGIATYATVGASYGYSLLWMIVVITFSLAVVQEMAARMGAVTGKGLSDLIREQFGVRWTAFAMLTILIANGGTIASEFAGIAAALELFGVSKYISVPVIAIVLWWLVVKGSYRRVERVFLLLTTAFFGYIISAFLAGPDWGQVIRHTLMPSFRLEAGYIYMFVATVGTTITPYMQLFQQSSVVEKGITVAEYPLERLDTLVGVLFSDLISFFIIVATGATLFVHGIQVQTAADAAQALAPLAGPYASALFAAGLFGASMLAAGVLPLATSFAICEAFGWESGVNHDFDEAPVFYSLFTGLIVLGALTTLIPGLPLFQVLVLVQVVNGVLLPVLLVFMMRLTNDRELMGDYVNGPLFNLVAWATTIGVGGLAILLIVVSVILPIVGIHPGS